MTHFLKEKEISNLRHKIYDLNNVKAFKNNLFTEEYKKNFPNIDEEIEKCKKRISQLEFEIYTSNLQKGKYYKYNKDGNFYFIFIKNLTDKRIVEETIGYYSLPTNHVINPPKKRIYTNTTDNLYVLGDSAKYIEITKDEYDRACSIVNNIKKGQETLQKIMA